MHKAIKVVRQTQIFRFVVLNVLYYIVTGLMYWSKPGFLFQFLLIFKIENQSFSKNHFSSVLPFSECIMSNLTVFEEGILELTLPFLQKYITFNMGTSKYKLSKIKNTTSAALNTSVWMNASGC